MDEPIAVTSLVLFEFRQSVRLQTFLHRNDATRGYGDLEGSKMLAKLSENLGAGLLRIASVDLANVFAVAESLSGSHTSGGGYGSFDILHVATAIELRADYFLTFDGRQAVLAKAAGLKVRP